MIQIKQKLSSPTLQTVLMVDKFIKDHNGDFKKTNLFHALPKKMKWGTFQVIMEYLIEINKIMYDRDGYVVYIWNPEIYNKYKNRPEVKL